MQGANHCREYLGLNPKGISQSRGRKTQTKFYSRVRKHPNVVCFSCKDIQTGRGNVPAVRQRRKFLHESYFQSELTIKQAA